MAYKIAEEDRRRLHESRLDAAALAHPENLTSEAALEAAATVSRDRVVTARQALKAAVWTDLTETSETKAAREQLDAAKSAALALYGFATQKARADLLLIDPEQLPSTPADVETRARQIALAFPSTFAELRDLAPDKVADALEATASALAAAPELAALALHPRLEAAAARLAAAATAWKSETHQDKDATDSLRKARATIDRAMRAHAAQIGSILIALEREGELGRFIRAEEPSYKARRLAGRALGEEPDILSTDVEPEPDVPPVPTL